MKRLALMYFYPHKVLKRFKRGQARGVLIDAIVNCGGIYIFGDGVCEFQHKVNEILQCEQVLNTK